MKSTVQRNIGKSTYTYVLWAILIALPGTTFLAILTNWLFNPHSNAVAVFGDYPVSQKMYRSTVSRVQHEIEDIRRRMGDYADQMLEASGLASQKPEEIAMQLLRSQKTMVCAADKVGLHTISPDYVARKSSDVNFATHYLADLIPAYLFAGAELNPASMKKYIIRQGLSETDYAELIQDRFKGILLMGLVPTVSYQPHASRYVAFLKQNGVYTFESVTVPLAPYIAKARKQPVDAKVLREYYTSQNTAHKRYWTPEKRSGTIWTFAPEGYGVEISKTDEQLYYGEHRQEFGAKTFEEAQKDITERLKFERFMTRFNADVSRMSAHFTSNPKEFTEFCARHKGVSRQVSDLMVSKIEEPADELYALFSLPGIGSMQVVESSGKGMIVVLDSMQKSVCPPYEQVAQQVEQDFYKEKAAQELATVLDGLVDQAGAKDFVALVEKKLEGATRATIGPVAAQAQEQWQKLAKQKLPAKRMKNMVHVNDALAYLQDESGVLIYLKDIQVPSGVTYDESKQSALGLPEDIDLQRQELLSTVAKDMKIKYTTSTGKQSGIYYDE
jgi:hypothetical protein